jgi:N-methylhydantoinase B
VLRSTDVRERFGAGLLPAGAGDLAASETVVLAAKALSAINEGDVVISGTPGGGGFGDPLRRDPDAVARDVLAGLVSEAAASGVYGVVAPGGACDAPATELTRRELRAARVAGGSGAPPAAAPGGVSRPVGDTLEAVGALLRCGACGAALGGYDADQRSLGVDRERPLGVLGDRFAACDAEYVLREQSCPGCGTLFGVDVQQRGDPPLPGARLRGDALAGR